MTTTNFPDGVTNGESANNPFGGLTFPDPTKCHTYMNDFDQYVAADWINSNVGAASAALTAGNGGLLLLTNAAADNNTNSLQKTPAGFAFTANKKAWFSCKFQCSDATQSDVLVGIVIVNTSPVATPPTDGIYFLKADDAATIDIIGRKNTTTGSNSKTAIATLVSATDIVLSWYYNGDGRLFYGVNGVLSGSMDMSSNYLPDATNLTVTMQVQNGEAVAKTMTVDYVFAAFER